MLLKSPVPSPIHVLGQDLSIPDTDKLYVNGRNIVSGRHLKEQARPKESLIQRQVKRDKVDKLGCGGSNSSKHIPADKALYTPVGMRFLKPWSTQTAQETSAWHVCPCEAKEKLGGVERQGKAIVRIGDTQVRPATRRREYLVCCPRVYGEVELVHNPAAENKGLRDAAHEAHALVARKRSRG